MLTDKRKTRLSEVPAGRFLKFVLVIVLLIAPAILLFAVPNLIEDPIMLGGKTILAYYLILAVLGIRALWRSPAYVEIERRMEGRRVLRPLWLAFEFFDAVAVLAVTTLLIIFLIKTFV